MMYRDSHSKALINNDLEALNKYKRERDTSRKMRRMSEDYSALSKELSEVKQTLTKLCQVIERMDKQ